jgi:hypothetical protein
MVRKWQPSPLVTATKLAGHQVGALCAASDSVAVMNGYIVETAMPALASSARATAQSALRPAFESARQFGRVDVDLTDRGVPESQTQVDWVGDSVAGPRRQELTSQRAVSLSQTLVDWVGDSRSTLHHPLLVVRYAHWAAISDGLVGPDHRHADSAVSDGIVTIRVVGARASVHKS